MAACSQTPGFFRAMRTDFAALARFDGPQRAAGATGTLGDLPLIVITHGQPFPGPFAVVERSWAPGQERLSKLSTDSELLVATDANHMIQLDSPDVVLDAVRRVHAAAASGRPLRTAAPAGAAVAV
jgi:pimeloyl-ACP methyl ester carboxylesterase